MISNDNPENFPYIDNPSRDAEKIVFEKLKEIFGNEKDFDIYYNVEIDHGSSPTINRTIGKSILLYLMKK